MDTFETTVNTRHVSGIVTRAAALVLESDVAGKMVRVAYWDAEPFRLTDGEHREVSLNREGAFLAAVGSATLTVIAVDDSDDYHVLLEVGSDEYLSEQFFGTLEELLIAVGRDIERSHSQPVTPKPKSVLREETNLGRLLREKLSKT